MCPSCLGSSILGSGCFGNQDGVKKVLSHIFLDAVVNPDGQRYQGLGVLSQFSSGQFILDGVRQTQMESGDQCLSIPPTLGGEWVELNGEVSHWSGPLAEVEQSASRFSSANWGVKAQQSMLSSEG